MSRRLQGTTAADGSHPLEGRTGGAGVLRILYKCAKIAAITAFVRDAAIQKKPPTALDMIQYRCYNNTCVWSCGVVVNMSACQAEDRGFKSRQLRHNWI